MRVCVRACVRACVPEDLDEDPLGRDTVVRRFLGRRPSMLMCLVAL
jgi:hypothetical protein